MSSDHVYGATGDILISLTPLGLPGRLQQAEPRTATDLEQIQMVRVENRRPTGLVRIGAAATADHFRRWATARDGGDWRWMLDAIPAVSAATSVGWTQMACHGGGVAHTAICDLVVAIEFVNYVGEIQTITDVKVLRAVSAGFGVFGVILSQTFRASKLKLATMRPHKIPAPLAIPPPSRAFALHADDFDASKYSDAELEDAREEFVEDTARFQCEWTWYPFSKDVYVNTWDTRTYSADSRPLFPSNKEVRWQRAHVGISELFGRTALRLLPRAEPARLFSKTVMAALPSDKRIDASVPDAMLFRRGVERFDVRRMSMLIPVIQFQMICFVSGHIERWNGHSEIRGERRKKYLRDVYDDGAKEFMAQMKVIAKEGGYEVDDMLNAFGNERVLEIVGYQKKKGWLPGPLSR